MTHKVSKILTPTTLVQKSNTPFFGPVIQTKLSVNEPGDKYELEADSVSEKIINSKPISGTETFFAPTSSVSIQRQCSACEQEEQLNRKETSSSVPTVTPSVHTVLSTPGQSLDPMTRGFMETRFSRDFSNVRIHNDSLSHQSSADISAKAYTHKNHIVFGKGQFEPSSIAGKKLLAHELTHVVQQSSGNGFIARQPQTKPECPFSEVKRLMLLSLPLPWGIQFGDTQADIERKQLEMVRDPDLNTLVSKCIQTNAHLFSFITRAQGFCIQDIVEAADKGQPFPIISQTRGNRLYEAIADPRQLSRGTTNTPLKYRVTGPDASTGAQVTMRDSAHPQCGDVCAAADRALTAEQLQNDDVAVRSCCSANECTEISKKAAVAAAYTTRTISRMRAGLAMNESMKRHFKKSDAAMYADILEGLTRILPELNFASHNWICRQGGNAAEGCMSANTKFSGKSIGGRGGHWRIQLCFNGGTVPFENVLHEIAHVAFTGPTDSYYKASKDYPGNFPLNNADSFSNLVKEVGDPDWEEEQNRAKDLEINAGLSVSGQAVRPIFGAKLVITPFGKGVRVLDFATSLNVLWSPAKGVIDEGSDPLRNKVQLGVDLLGRIRPSRSLYLDIGTGVLSSVALQPDLDVTAIGSIHWRPGGGTSGINLGIDFKTVFDNADAKPDELIIGVSFGGSWSGEPKRRKPVAP